MRLNLNLQNEVKLPSNKKFGLFLSFVFLCFAIYLYINEYFITALIVLLLLLTLLLISIISPKILEPINKLWMIIGLLLGKIFNPIILGIIFFMILTPMSIIMRLSGRDALMIKNKNRASFWKKRDINEFSSSSFENQF